MQYLLPKLKEEFLVKSHAARKLNADLLQKLRNDQLTVTSEEYKTRKAQTNNLIEEVKELRKLIKALEADINR